jgi:hypothetical protein
MRARAFLLGVVIAAAALGHWTGGHSGLAQTGGSSNSNSNTNSGSSSSNGNSNGNSNNGSSNSGGSNSNNNSGSSSSNTGVTVPGGGTTPATATPATAGPSATPATTVAPEKVKPAKSTGCPSDVDQPGVQCYRIRPTGNPGGARLPDGRVVVLPPGPSVNVDTGASTSNDIDQVIVVNNDNRVINREPLNSRVRQWFIATIGLLLLVLVAAAVGAAIFRAGLRQGRGGPDEK